MGALGGFGNLLMGGGGSNLMSGIMNLLMGASQWGATEEAKKANKDLENEIRGEFGNQRDFARQQLMDPTFGQPGIMQGYGNLFEAAKSGNLFRNEGVLNEINKLGGEVNQGLQNRYDRGMGYIDKISNQAMTDLNRQYDAAGNKAQADLVSSGLSGSTVSGGLRRGFERSRGEAQNRLNDMTLRERLGTDAALSGDIISGRERMGGAYINERSRQDTANQAATVDAGNNLLGYAQNALGQRLGTGLGINNNFVNFLNSISHQYPDPALAANYSAGFGANAGANIYQDKVDSASYLGPLLGSFGQIGAGVGLGFL